ncbi:hypothetical protein THTE_3119 [Thermogutta terrifontis]|uniref:Uncharacterized protein n=1 Tax=Thermogutta terrifontis TaxID=1331910 RepID=A0A286RID3_9BACT|nr:hypothetical protein THTE_3119 [Thermogutta terrifontis]
MLTADNSHLLAIGTNQPDGRTADPLIDAIGFLLDCWTPLSAKLSSDQNS